MSDNMSRKTIGVMIGNANSTHTIDTVKGIVDAAKNYDVNTISFIGVHSSYYYRDYFEKENQEDYDYQSSCIFDYDKLCQIDALIVSYGTMAVFMSERELKEFQRKISGIPTVYLENKVEGPNARYIMLDNYYGMKQIMKHLLEYHGYKNILYLSGPEGNLDADERLRAYKDAMGEANLNVSELMVEYGDFSDSVEAQVNSLLDKNPNAEALVCANDLMALTAYKVVKERAKLYEEACDASDKESMRRYKKHIVGSDSEFGIAITGYDNDSDSANVDPPLTTVEQTPYSYGYMAVKTALGLMSDPQNTKSNLCVPRLIVRQSCGCKSGGHLEFPDIDDRYRVHPELYAVKAAEIFTNGILSEVVNDSLVDEAYSAIYEIIINNMKRYYGIAEEIFTIDELLDDVKALLNSNVCAQVPPMAFIQAFNDLMSSILKNAIESDKKYLLIDVQSKITEYIYSKLFSDTKENLMMYRHRTWFMPLISRDMANNLDSLKDMYYSAMIKMNVLKSGDTYLLIADEPIRHGKSEKWQCPESLRLVAYSEGGQVTAYEPNEAPLVTKNNVINNFMESDDGSNYSASIVNLYSGEYQYGVIIAKTTPDEVLSLYCASLQISTALKYCEMARAQRRTQDELQHIIKEVEEKNEILRSLSEYDQLTGCYNRRGFLEKGIALIRENVGAQACIVFADLDHLKEINDKFGHSEGDFAIENIARSIKVALPDSAILARLGGDEFVAVFLLSGGMDAEDVVRNISNMSVSFNAMSAKPYYVECSVGYTTFTCEADTSIESVMGHADSYLYEAKARRRKSITKKFTII